MNLKAVHAPTLIIAVIVIFALLGIYHVTLGRRR